MGGGRTRGLAYTLSVASQGNIILVVTRAVKPGAASGAPLTWHRTPYIPVRPLCTDDFRVLAITNPTT